jgi:hypothetical protein
MMEWWNCGTKEKIGEWRIRKMEEWVKKMA